MMVAPVEDVLEVMEMLRCQYRWEVRVIGQVLNARVV